MKYSNISVSTNSSHRKSASCTCACRKLHRVAGWRIFSLNERAPSTKASVELSDRSTVRCLISLGFPLTRRASEGPQGAGSWTEISFSNSYAKILRALAARWFLVRCVRPMVYWNHFLRCCPAVPRSGNSPQTEDYRLGDSTPRAGGGLCCAKAEISSRRQEAVQADGFRKGQTRAFDEEPHLDQER